MKSFLTVKKTKRGKALWYRQKFGDKPAVKPRPRIRPVSRRNVARRQEYARAVKRWKLGRLCACRGLHVNNVLVCGMYPHSADSVHHRRGKIGPLLLDQRFWIGTCAMSHRWITDHTTMARALGLLCEVGEWITVPRLNEL